MAHVERNVKGKHNPREQSPSQRESEKIFSHNRMLAGLLLIAAWTFPADIAAEKPNSYKSESPLGQRPSRSSTSSSGQQEKKLVIPQQEEINPFTQEGMLWTIIPRYRTLTQDQQKHTIRGRCGTYNALENALIYFPKTTKEWVPQNILQARPDQQYFLVGYADSLFVWEMGQYIDPSGNKIFSSKCTYWKNHKAIMVLRTPNTGDNPNFPLNNHNVICHGAPLELKNKVAWDDSYGLILIDEKGSIVGQYDLENIKIKETQDSDFDSYESRLSLRDSASTPLYLRPRLLKQPVSLSKIGKDEMSQLYSGLVPLKKDKVTDPIEKQPSGTILSSPERMRLTLTDLMVKQPGLVDSYDVERYIENSDRLAKPSVKYLSPGETGYDAGVTNFKILPNAKGEPALLLIRSEQFGIKNQAIDMGIRGAVNQLNLIDPQIVDMLVTQGGLRGVAADKTNLSAKKDFYKGRFDDQLGLIWIDEKAWVNAIYEKQPVVKKKDDYAADWSRFVVHNMLLLLSEGATGIHRDNKYSYVAKWMIKHKETFKTVNELSEHDYLLFLISVINHRRYY